MQYLCIKVPIFISFEYLITLYTYGSIFYAGNSASSLHHNKGIYDCINGTNICHALNKYQVARKFLFY